NKESKQHKTDALPETVDKSENTNSTLIGAMMALLGSLLLIRKRKQDHKEKA
ncbi:LPXTG cell wall anchor domain-containing protein, partial [Staphylococcus aureus]|nr:LPXTG cell wall anchor domain-containing protein [Staphylococcus aureus]